MTFKKLLLVPAAISAFAVAAPAHADTLLFDFAGGERSFSFILDTDQSPDTTRDVLGSSEIGYNNVSGMFNGVGTSSDTATRITFGTGFLAPINIVAPGFGFGNFGGPDLFNGSLTDPIFNLGTFSLFQANTGGGSLTISQVSGAVPEPATWAMLMLGFGIMGYALRRTRRTKVKTSVRFANA